MVHAESQITMHLHIQGHRNTNAVTCILDFQPKGLAELMDGMISRLMQSEASALSSFKAYPENKG